MANLTDFLPWTAVSAEGVPRNVMLAAIRQACDTFCVYSGIWYELVNDLQAVADVDSYDIDHPSNSRIVRLEGVAFAGVPITPREPQQGVLHAAVNGGMRYWFEEPDQLRVAPAPAGTVAATDVFSYKVVLAPARTATVVPNVLRDEYELNIADGALSILLAIPGKGWTDQREAERRAQQFRAAAAHAKVRAATGTTTNIVAPAHVYFG